MPRKLLLADDSVTIQRVIELTFADEDIQVIAVGDGEEAIRRVQSDRPDIVLAAIGMPERDGYEVAAFIKGTPQFAHIPVLLLRGAFEPVDEGRVRAAGCDGVLVKPFEPQLVIRRVKDLIGEGPAPVGSVSLTVPQAARPMTPAHAMPGTAPAALTPVQPVRPPASSDDYFDRLDAAFSSLDERHSPVAASQVPMGPPSSEAHPPTKGAASEEAAHDGSMRAADDALIERITQRVVERIGDGAVKDIVLEVAERLVRQEIERIKAHLR